MTTKFCNKCQEEYPIEVFKFQKSSCYTCQLQMSRDWKARNKERANEYTRNWKKENKEHVSVYNAAYDEANREKIRPLRNAYHKERAKTDPNFKLSKNLRNRYNSVLKADRLDESSLTILGCPIDSFKLWLEYRFADDMTFENHGQLWNLDHVVPIAKFDLIGNEDEICKCFHWTNFQPLHSRANLSKNCYVTNEEIDSHEKHIRNFLDILPEEERCLYTLIEINRKSYVTKTRKRNSNRGATKVSQE